MAELGLRPIGLLHLSVRTDAKQPRRCLRVLAG
jgi:hypothetical protein